jgi:hypothetical protein
MPNRPFCERESEYRELMKGHSEHKGEILSAVAVPPETEVVTSEAGSDAAIPSSGFDGGVQETVSRLFRNLFG